MENHCPHCDSSGAILTSVAYNNGSAQWSFYRCGDCNTEWKITRWLETIVTSIGKTPEEIRKEILNFASLWNAHSELATRNVPDHWHMYVR